MEALKMEKRQMDRWNDDRLDELSRRMDAGFKQVDADLKEGFARMEQKFEQKFDAIDRKFDSVDQKFDSVDQKFERLLHVLVLIAWGFAGTLVAALAAVLVAAVG